MSFSYSKDQVDDVERSAANNYGIKDVDLSGIKVPSKRCGRKTRMTLCSILVVLLGLGAATFVFYPRDVEIGTAAQTFSGLNVTNDQGDWNPASVVSMNFVFANGTVAPLLTNTNYVALTINSVDVTLSRGSLQFKVTSNKSVTLPSGESGLYPVRIDAAVPVDSELSFILASVAVECFADDNFLMNIAGTVTIDHPLKSGDIDVSVSDAKVPCS